MGFIGNCDQYYETVWNVFSLKLLCIVCLRKNVAYPFDYGTEVSLVDPVDI